MPIIKRNTEPASGSPSEEEPKMVSGDHETTRDEQEPASMSTTQYKSVLAYTLTALLGLAIPVLIYYSVRVTEINLNSSASQIGLVVESIEKLGLLGAVAQAELESNMLFLEQARETSTQATIDAYESITHQNRTQAQDYRARMHTSVLTLVNLHQANEQVSLQVLDHSINNAVTSSSAGNEKLLSRVKAIITNLPQNQADWPTYIAKSLDQPL